MTTQLSRKDFLSDSKPRWCAGCGDFGALKVLTDTFANTGLTKENLVVVSGIGCSSRLPYYTSSYGFHTIHGRAPTVAIGIKLVNPELMVWMVTGDGDALSIGGNHTIHMIRRNPDINVLLLNNQIYGLTKGQASPTSPPGTKSKSSPRGSVDQPIHPLTLALASGATFVARVSDRDPKAMLEIFTKAQAHKGTSFIEVLQNCPIFNDGIFDFVADKKSRALYGLPLVDGEKMLFGPEKDKGLRFRDGQFETVDLKAEEAKIEEIAVHRAGQMNPGLALQLSSLDYPEFPYPLGILRQVETPTLEGSLLNH